jgi:hypothetical protein
MPFNSYTGQLAVSVQDTAASQWTEGSLSYLSYAPASYVLIITIDEKKAIKIKLCFYLATQA